MCFSACVNDSDLLPNNYNLFRGTPVWKLAKAVKRGDIEEIKHQVMGGRVDINFQEPKFGGTLLMLTVYNQNYKSCKALLELGADPNKHEYWSGSTALIEAAGIENFSGDNTLFLRLLLAHGANVNEEETGVQKEGNTTRRTPLIVACQDVNQFVSPIHKVKLLVEAGANVNYKNEYNQFPLGVALLHSHNDIAFYLLQKGADYNEIFIDRSLYQSGGKKIYILDILREQFLPLNSEKYRYKMMIVDFLKSKGIDYRKSPIPDFVIREAKEKYPSSWKAYLGKY